MIEQLMHVMDHVSPHVVFYIGNIPVTNTVVNTWLVMLVLIAMALVVTRSGFKLIPKGWQHLPEIAVEFVLSLMESLMDKKAARRYVPYVATLFIFILFLNLSWFIPGMKPPTMDLSTTFAFGLTTIIVVQFIAIREKGGKKYLKHYASPNAVMAPLNVIEELVKPISLSLRLFGNMFGEEMAVVILGILVPIVVPSLIQLLGVLMGFIQAFVFTLLSATYISMHLSGH